MKNTIGSSVSITVFGESHGKAVGAVLDGLCPGIPVDGERIANALVRRRPSEAGESARRESDKFEIISGVFNGCTTGSPLCTVIPNEDVQSEAYERGLCRPSHADLAAYVKYHGFEDYRGGGHFSGRVTAPIVAAGEICAAALEMLGIRLATHISALGDVTDTPFAGHAADIVALRKAAFPTLSESAAEKMRAVIVSARDRGDSIGGITETAVAGLPAGVGEPLFDSVEGVLSHALFAIGGIKGVEFGGGFDACRHPGSEYNDALRYENGSVVTKTNNDGGINGGISNGMPIIFRCAVKPTPSIAIEQETVDIISKENTAAAIKGRHDAAIIRRICPVIDAVTAIVLCDLLAQRYGTDVFTKGIG